MSIWLCCRIGGGRTQMPICLRCRNLSSPPALRFAQHGSAVSQQPSGHLLSRSELLAWTRHLACANVPARNTVNKISHCEGR